MTVTEGVQKKLQISYVQGPRVPFPSFSSTIPFIIQIWALRAWNFWPIRVFSFFCAGRFFPLLYFTHLRQQADLTGFHQETKWRSLFVDIYKITLPSFSSQQCVIHPFINLPPLLPLWCFRKDIPVKRATSEYDNTFLRMSWSWGIVCPTSHGF